MPAPQADFKSLKQRIPIDHVLARYGVKLRSVGPHTLCGACPLPTHTSRQSRQSFSVNLALQVWSCHSASCIAARGGRMGGHVIDLVAIMERCSLREAGLRLQDWFSAGALHPAPVRTPAMVSSSAAPNRPLGFALQRIDIRHPYLAQRGISPATARLFGVGIYDGNGFLAGRCVIPIRDEKNQLVAYAGRAVNWEEPKYRFPAGFRKSLVLFNLDRAMQTGGRNVIVVEGFFDALKIHQAGYPTVVALMGASFSQRQSELLLSHFASVTLMLDGDEPGRRAAQFIEQLLTAKLPVKKVDLPTHIQPDQLSQAEINVLVGPPTCTL
ncbi:MAG: toprim domain-containing protein [Terriglobales bacterium]|jgi:DNA primase